MVQQLLQKTRNKFLQITPPENLIPNKRIGKKGKRRFNRRILYNQHYRSLINRRYLANTSISRKENIPVLRNANASPNLFLRFAISHFSWRVEKVCFPRAALKSVIQPKQHSVIDKLNRVVGRSIVNFLATSNIRYAKGIAQRKPIIEYKKRPAPTRSYAWQPQHSRCANYPDYPYDASKCQDPRHAEASQVICSKKGQFLTVCGSGGREFTPSTNSKASKALLITSKTHATLFFSIQWDSNALLGKSLVELPTRCAKLIDFLRNQLYGNFWNYLFSIHDINNAPLKRNRVNDQFKNQYIEYKKLAILYGNLPKRTLAHIMRRATKEGGEIESKFLFILERRLDVILKRLFFFPTIKSARQWIHQGKILVNNQICTYNSYLLQPADLISIKKEFIITWRKEWFKHFHIVARNRSGYIENVVQRQERNQWQVPSQDIHRDAEGSGIAERGRTVYKKRRFFFSPSLMQKWSVWSKLWSSISCNRTDAALKGKTHRWSRKCYMQGNFSHPFFNSSAFAAYLHVAKHKTDAALGKLAQRQSGIICPKEGQFPTPCGSEERRFPTSSAGAALSLNKEKCAPAFFNRFSISTIPLLRWLSKKLPRRKREKKNQYFMQFLSALLSLRQQSRVVDGNFQHRWNKIFTKKKLIVLKKKDWQWSCIKPMHFECSYRRPSAIYLYPPQKLVWPSSINVLLLKTALN